MSRAPYDYVVELDAPAAETPCACGGGCGWTGTYAQLTAIDGCSLTPGDPSPAGRCPVETCDSLAYIVKPPAQAAAQDVVAALCLVYHSWQVTNDLLALNLGSADEHVNDERLTKDQEGWLRAFILVWDGAAS